MISLAKPIIVTAGEPAGIGPDLCVHLATTDWASEIIVLGDIDMLARRAKLLASNIELVEYDATKGRETGTLQVLSKALVEPADCGHLNPRNSQSLLDGLDRAVAGCLSGEFSAMVTAPLQKSAIIDAGIVFTGHTEYLATKTATPTPVMLLAANDLRVALASTHMPLREVADYLTSERIVAIIEVLHRDLVAKFAIHEPRILVCGLNPHAGESGHLGSEDEEVILPAINACRSRGINVEGPLPADTAFTPAAGKSDAILAMYHDQGLPVIKYAGFGNAVNVTLGLPFIRTSVDHGTALDLAGRGTADNGSMLAAVALAAQLAIAG
jgi:4-hydroxythreonine-4-phosphate dehydrogenase